MSHNLEKLIRPSISQPKKKTVMKNVCRKHSKNIYVLQCIEIILEGSKERHSFCPLKSKKREGRGVSVGGKDTADSIFIRAAECNQCVSKCEDQ